MNALAHISPETRAKRTILNDTFRAIRELRPRVTQIIVDPAAILALKVASLVPRTLLHPKLPGSKK
jgi:hypothetical protein